MTDQFVGEIRMFGGNFAPRGWALCNGALVNIADNNVLYSLLGTVYGGNGTTNFALPDLRGRVPIHQGQGTGLSQRQLGASGGVEEVTLTLQQIPGHAHGIFCSTDPGSNASPEGGVPATPTLSGSGRAPSLYVVPGSSQFDIGAMATGTLGLAGSNVAHDNMMPSLCVSFIIALTGIYPSRN